MIQHTITAPRLPRQPPGQPVRTVTDKVKPFIVKVKLKDKTLSMELHTGVMFFLKFQVRYFNWQLVPGVTVQPTATKLQSYSGDAISVLGQVEVEVTYLCTIISL